MLDKGYKQFLLLKNRENGPATSPERQLSPAKAASSVNTGAGPIRACYNAGCATTVVTQAKAARYKHICASEPENVCTLLAAAPTTPACWQSGPPPLFQPM